MSRLRPGEIATFSLRVAQIRTEPGCACAAGDELTLARDPRGLCLHSLKGSTVGRVPERYTSAMVRYLAMNPERSFRIEVERVSRTGLWLRFSVPEEPGNVLGTVAPLLTAESPTMYVC